MSSRPALPSEISGSFSARPSGSLFIHILTTQDLSWIRLVHSRYVTRWHWRQPSGVFTHIAGGPSCGYFGSGVVISHSSCLPLHLHFRSSTRRSGRWRLTIVHWVSSRQDRSSMPICMFLNPGEQSPASLLQVQIYFTMWSHYGWTSLFYTTHRPFAPGQTLPGMNFLP